MKAYGSTESDENNLPLSVSISALIGEVVAWADYVLPATTCLEKFAVPGQPPSALVAELLRIFYNFADRGCLLRPLYFKTVVDGQ